MAKKKKITKTLRFAPSIRFLLLHFEFCIPLPLIISFFFLALQYAMKKKYTNKKALKSYIELPYSIITSTPLLSTCSIRFSVAKFVLSGQVSKCSLCNRYSSRECYRKIMKPGVNITSGHHLRLDRQSLIYDCYWVYCPIVQSGLACGQSTESIVKKNFSAACRNDW